MRRGVRGDGVRENGGRGARGADGRRDAASPARPARAGSGPAAELREVSFSYGRRPVLAGVSLEFFHGEVAGILGPNGCGKSTAVKLLGRALSPAGGSVILEGDDAAPLSRREVARRVAVMPQGAPAPSMRVDQLVMGGRYPHRPALAAPSVEDEEAVHRALERAGCAHLAAADLSRLSGGERQRAYLAMVLAQQAGVVAMDEPTAFLDPGACFELMSLARGLAREGAAVVMVLHDVPLALSCCDRVAVLAEGRVQARGTPEEVAASGAVDRVFGVRLLRADVGDGPGRPAWALRPAGTAE